MKCGPKVKRNALHNCPARHRSPGEKHSAVEGVMQVIHSV